MKIPGNLVSTNTVNKMAELYSYLIIGMVYQGRIKGPK